VQQIKARTKRQRSKHSFSVWILLIAATSSFASAQDPVAQLVSRVSGNVSDQQRSIPDFVANEEVTIQILESDKLIHETHIISQFQAVHSDAKGQSNEQRTVISSTGDGKPQKRSGYALPIGVRGGFAEDAPGYFGGTNPGCFDFEILRQDQLRGRNAIVLAVRRKKSPLADSSCAAARKVDATAWIDAETYQILRLELGEMKQLDYSVPFGRENGVYTFSPVIEYGEVKIADRSYWVPIEKRVDFVKTNRKVVYKYIVRYSDFHKFLSTSRIVEAGEPVK
jgi:hypothetical protein